MNSVIISIISSFLVSYLMTPLVMSFFRAALVVGEDQQKKGKPKLPTSGGVCFVIGALFGIFVFITMQTFVEKSQSGVIELLAISSSILISTFIGFLDDVGVRIDKKKAVTRVDLKNNKQFGFKAWQKPLFTLPIAIPLMAIKAGQTGVVLPLTGYVDLGLLYPLLLIPLGVIGCTNMVNMLAGFNGSEAGMGVIYLASIGVYAWTHGANMYIPVLCFCAAASLLAFLRFNLYPARMLPGDSLTYTLGGIAASAIIMGNMERAGLVIMFPFIVEGVLKFYSLLSLGRFAHSIGKLKSDGTLQSLHGKKIYSIAHILQRFCLTEKQITLSMWSLSAFFAIIPHVIW